MDNVILRNTQVYIAGDKVFSLPTNAEQVFAFKTTNKEGKEILKAIDGEMFKIDGGYYLVPVKDDLYRKVLEGNVIQCYSFEIHNKKENKTFTKVIPCSEVQNKLCAYQDGKFLGLVNRD